MNMNDEKTIYDNEKTQYQSLADEATQYGEPKEKEATSAADNVMQAPSTNHPTWKTVALGGVTGIVLGASATLFSSATPVDAQTNDSEADPESSGTAQETVYTEVSFASSVSDDMSFGQAFAAARAEVGSGGAFEWRGNVYSTFTAEEWNGMSAEQRNEYGSHVYGHEAHHTTSYTAHTAQTSDDVEVSNTETDNHNEQHQAHNEGSASDEMGGVSPAGDEVDVVGVDDSDVQVLGVVHDDETGANIGGMLIDGQEFVLIDVDGDGTFDAMGADLDGDGQLSQGEIADISQEGITVDTLEGLSHQGGAFYASNDAEPDYINDADIYDV